MQQSFFLNIIIILFKNLISLYDKGVYFHNSLYTQNKRIYVHSTQMRCVVEINKSIKKWHNPPPTNDVKI